MSWEEDLEKHRERVRHEQEQRQKAADIARAAKLKEKEESESVKAHATSLLQSMGPEVAAKICESGTLGELATVREKTGQKTMRAFLLTSKSSTGDVNDYSGQYSISWSGTYLLEDGRYAKSFSSCRSDEKPPTRIFHIIKPDEVVSDVSRRFTYYDNSGPYTWKMWELAEQFILDAIARHIEGNSR
jgi:hypothetical protein